MADRKRERVSTGIPGLDDVTDGGYSRRRLMLIEGVPGSGKTTLALQSRRIRMSARHASVLLIALTGWGQEQDRQRSREAGFDHHLVKPPDIKRLHQLVTANLPTRHRRGEGAA